MTSETTLPLVLTDEDGDKIERLTKRRQKLDGEWRQAIREAVEKGATLREVAARADISHTAVKFIAHGRG